MPGNRDKDDKDKKEIKRKFTRKPNTQEDVSEAPEKRPETDCLKQLKYQTENRLDTLRSLKCIPTKQAEEAGKLLERNRSVVIRGNPGEGKTTTALHLIDNEMYKDKRVVLYSPQDWKTMDTEWVNIVVLEDIFGQFELDSGRLKEWMVYLRSIQELVDAGKLQVIITTRADILSKAYSELGSLKLFSDDLTLKLSSDLLIDSEKMDILNRELQRKKKTMKEDEKEKCIANFSGLVGFPQCCLLFAGDNKLFDKGPEFFKSPSIFFIENIKMLGVTRMLSLALLFCNHGEIREEHLSPETVPENIKQLLKELRSYLHISKQEVSITLLRDAYESFLDLYVVKSMSYDFSLGSYKPCIKFTHATVYEAVGQGVECPEMVVKYGDSEYLYQKTYTAKEKDSNSQNVFIPVSLYGLLAGRMVRDVIEGHLIQSIVKHSSLKQHDYLKKLNSKLQKENRIKDFFIPSYSSFNSGEGLSEGECKTFMQCILKNDEELVTLVYNEFLEFLQCAHTNNSSDCWKCVQKQELLELSLYYHHFEIADKLIHMDTCYTHVSLCNAAKHGDFVQVQTILKALKRSQVFNSGSMEAKYALIRAYISGSQSLIDLLLREGIILDSSHVVDAVKHGDINVLMNVVEHLKSHNKWNPHWEPYSKYHGYLNLHIQRPVTHLRERKEDSIPYSTALFLSFRDENLDMADYLLENGVNTLMCMLPDLVCYSSQNAVARVIKDLKDAEKWVPKCNDAFKALEDAYKHKKYGVCDLLVEEGVSFTMKGLPDLVQFGSCESIKKAIQNLKNTNNWDPKCDDACEALEIACLQNEDDVCDLLVQEGVLLTMKILPSMADDMASLKDITKAIQNLKACGNWDPKCDDASIALQGACVYDKYDVFDVLPQEGISLTMNHLHDVVCDVSLESIKKAIQNLKNTGNWDPKCDDASIALQGACVYDKYDVFDVLAQEGISLTMNHLPDVVCDASLESIKKAIENLKNTGNWDPKCNDASIALENAIRDDLHDKYDLLMQEGVSLTMKKFYNLVKSASCESIKRVIQNLKDSGNWDPKCDDVSEALENVIRDDLHDICDLLMQEGVSLPMNYLPYLVYKESCKSIKKAIQNLKDAGNWDPKCDDTSKALEYALDYDLHDECCLLMQEGVSLTMKNFYNLVKMASSESIKRAIQNLKDSGNWDPKCDVASNALEYAFDWGSDDKCDLLIKEGVSLTMKNFYNLVKMASSESIKRAIQNLKDSGNWDPKRDDAFKALEYACSRNQNYVFDLLAQEGISLRMKNLPRVVDIASIESIKKAIQNMKDTGNWDPTCDDASKALEKAYSKERYDVCDMLVQNGILLTMKHLPCVVSNVPFESIQKAIQNLKDTDRWDPDGDDASKALENSLSKMRYDVCDLLVQEGISLTMKNLPTVVSTASYEFIKRTIEHLQVTANWDPDCDYAFKALEMAYSRRKDVFYLLTQKGIS